LRHFTVIGANIRDTLLGKWLVMNGCSLVCHPLTDRLRFTDYPERDVMIFFALEKMRSSKYSMNPIMGGEAFDSSSLRRFQLNRWGRNKGGGAFEAECCNGVHHINRQELNKDVWERDAQQRMKHWFAAQVKP